MFPLVSSVSIILLWRYLILQPLLLLKKNDYVNPDAEMYSYLPCGSGCRVPGRLIVVCVVFYILADQKSRWLTAAIPGSPLYGQLNGSSNSSPLNTETNYDY